MDNEYLILNINNVTYRVKVHFSENATETFEDKMIRMTKTDMEHFTA